MIIDSQKRVSLLPNALPVLPNQYPSGETLLDWLNDSRNA